MQKLLKYEFRKTLFAKLVFLGLTALLEGYFLYTLIANKTSQEGIAMLLLVLLGTFGIVFMGIQSILVLHRDMNTRQGYMLFMTPNSCYRILGAKVLENGLSTLLAGAFYLAVGFGDVTLLLARNQSLEETLSVLRSFVEQMGQEINLTSLGVITFVVFTLCSWFATVCTAYLADVISSSLLNGKRGGLLISFLFLIVIDYAAGKILGLVPALSTAELTNIVRSAAYILLSCIMYWISARLMEKYLSV